MVCFYLQFEVNGVELINVVGERLFGLFVCFSRLKTSFSIGMGWFYGQGEKRDCVLDILLIWKMG